MYEEEDISQGRLRWGLLAAVAVVLIAAIPGVILSSGDDAKQVRSAEDLAPGTTTTTGVGVVAGVPMFPQLSTTTSTPTTVPSIQGSTTVPPPTTTVAPSPPPPPGAPCRNSFDPACGPFRWDPDPGPNAPLTVTVTPPSQQGNTTSSVNFHIVAHDPDAKIEPQCYSVDWGDGQKGTTCPAPPNCRTPYGPWTPPAKAEGQYDTDAQHRYATPSPSGQPYVASFTVQSHSFCYPDPYGGSAQGSAQVTVLP